MNKRILLTLVAASAALHGFAWGDIQVLARKGDVAPGRPGAILDEFGLPSINDANQVAYWGQAAVNATYPIDVFRFSLGSVTPVRVGANGDPAPGGGTFLDLSLLNPPGLNLSGQVAFGSKLASSNNGVYRASPTAGGVTRIVAQGDSAPDGNGTFFRVAPPIAFNSLGQAAFSGGSLLLSGTSGGTADDEGVFRGSGGSITQIAREGQSIPSGVGTFGANGGAGSGAPGSLAFAGPGLNDSGNTAFLAGVVGSGVRNDAGIFTGDGTRITQIARRGDLTPAGGTYTSFQSAPAINNSNQIAFVAEYDVNAVGTLPQGIFLNTAVSSNAVVRTGQLLRDGGFIYNIAPALAINNAGQVAAFIGTNTHFGTAGEGGLVRASVSGINLIATVGDTTPRGGSTIMSTFASQSVAMNDAGDLAFTAELDTNPADNVGNDSKALFFYSDSLGIVEIAQVGDALDGSVITDMSLAGATAARNQLPSEIGLSDLDQVTFHYNLASGSLGIAVWSVPEPTTAILLIGCGVRYGFCRRPKNFGSEKR